MFFKRYKMWSLFSPAHLVLLSAYLFHVLLFFCVQVHYGKAELRFCLPQLGPQRMRDEDCPGGFVFKEPVKPTCTFYARTGNQSGTVLTAPVNLCEPETDRILEAEDDLKDIETFTYFLWEEVPANDTKGAFDPYIEQCEMDCLTEWEDPHFAVDEEEIKDSFDESKLSEQDKKELKQFNKDMFMRLLVDDDTEEPKNKVNHVATTESSSMGPGTGTTAKTPPEKENKRVTRNATGKGSGEVPEMLPPRARIDGKVPGVKVGHSFLEKVIHDSSSLNVIKVLAKSMQVLLSACSPYVQPDFTEQILRGMIYVAQKMESTLLDLAPDIYKMVRRILDHCGLKRQQEFFLNGSRCEDKSVIEGIYFSKFEEFVPHKLTGWSFRWLRWHPLLDAAWSVIDFIHSYCFESFTQDFMLMHVFETSLEGLFPEKIQNLWRMKPVVNNDKFWNNLMQTYDLNITMRNLDACQQGALKMSPFIHHLPRPFLTKAELEAAPQSSSQNADNAPKGWNKTVDKYWDRYERLGGFKKLSEEFGTCFVEAHLEEEEAMIDELKQKCGG